jgi:hypothetical protein
MGTRRSSIESPMAAADSGALQKSFQLRSRACARALEFAPLAMVMSIVCWGETLGRRVAYFVIEQSLYPEKHEERMAP